MVIIGIVGLNGSGKNSFAELANQLLNYKKINLQENPQEFDKILSNWQIPTIVYPITTKKQIDSLAKRQYFHLVFIDGPINLRYKRYLEKHKDSQITFEEFIDLDDQLKFRDRLIDCIKYCKVKIINDHRSLEDVILQNRPSWEVYFMRIAYNLKQRSNCMKKSVGAVLVDKYKRIISTSYNGTPKVMTNCNQGGCDVCNQDKSLDLILYKCMCIHAEEGCILEAGVAASRGSSIYTTLFPCVWCCKALLQAGVEWIYYDEEGDWELPKKFIDDLIRIKQVRIDEYIF